MPQFYPNVGKPRPTVTRQTSLSGKKYKGGHKPDLDPLEEWEGSRTFRDARSPTGWTSRKGHVIGAVTVNGVPLLLTKTGKLMFNPPDDDGNLLGKVLKVWSPAFAAMEFQQEFTRGVFGPEVGALTQGLAGNLANAVLPGLGQVVGIAQNIDAILDGEGPEWNPTVAAPELVDDMAAGPPARSSVPPLAIAAGLLLLLLVVSR